MKRAKIIIPVFLFVVAVAAKFILWDFAVSNGRRTGNLVKISEKGKLIKTWEGKLDLGSGDLLTFDFSVKDERLAREMFNYEGREVSILYEEHLLGWPRETKYNVVRWTPKDGAQTNPAQGTSSNAGAAAALLNKTMFCSTLGALYEDQDLYQAVKSHLKSNNLYLYRQIEKCNE